MGNHRLAREWFDQFFEALRAADTPAGEWLDGLLALSALEYDAGDDERALELAKQALDLAEKKVSDPARQAVTWVRIGHTTVGMQRPAEAKMAYEQALAIYEALGDVQRAVEPRAVEPRAGLAHIALMEGDIARAQHLVEAILVALAVHPCAGLDEPFFAYLTCARALDAAGDPRAETVRHAGRKLLGEYANRLGDEAQVRSFLEGVPVHRDLWQA